MHALDRPERRLYPDSVIIGGTIVRPRAPIFALTTALTCVVSAYLLSARGSWMWSIAFISIGTMMGVWQVHIVCSLPILVVRGPVVALYRRGVRADSFALSDLLIAEGSLSIGIALFALVLASTVLSALGISLDLETSLSLRLSSTQRLILSMIGVWLAGAAVSLSYLDFPRRKLLLRGASRCSSVIYFDARKQRKQLLTFLRALQLEKVMLRVGLGSYVPTTELRDGDSPYDRGNGPAQ
jgi:hypothetical protein